jgi:hypothetical protein
VVTLTSKKQIFSEAYKTKRNKFGGANKSCDSDRATKQQRSGLVHSLTSSSTYQQLNQEDPKPPKVTAKDFFSVRAVVSDHPVSDYDEEVYDNDGNLLGVRDYETLLLNNCAHTFQFNKKQTMREIVSLIQGSSLRTAMHRE